jgi:hypothetical protein
MYQPLRTGCWCRVARIPHLHQPHHCIAAASGRHGTTSQAIDPYDRNLCRRLSPCRAALKRNRPDRCNRSTLTERPPTQTRVLLRRAGTTPASSAPSRTGAKQSQFLLYTTACAFTFSYCHPIAPSGLIRRCYSPFTAELMFCHLWPLVRLALWHRYDATNTACTPRGRRRKRNLLAFARKLAILLHMRDEMVITNYCRFHRFLENSR